MQSITIAQIKEMFQKNEVTESMLEKLKRDKRKGVQRLVVQFERKREREKALQEQFYQKKNFDLSFVNDDNLYIAGVDEAGRGPLAGPVVAAAVILPRDFYDVQLNESKQLTERQRKNLFEVITTEAISYAYAIVSNDKIDRYNILTATKMAMHDALRRLTKKPDLALIDAVEIDDLDFPQRAIIDGDQKSLAIGAASIIAKVIRDDIMAEIHREYPMYDFQHNKGYGTKTHLDALKKYGVTKYHRKSFTPVQAYSQS